MAQTSERVYEDFEPISDLLSKEQCDTLLLYLPGFRKEQMKVHLSALGKLRVFGERPIGGNKWRRFQKEFNVPPNIDFKEMTAKFEGGILYIRQPKLIAPEQENEEKAAAEAPAPELQQQPSSEEKKDEEEEDATKKSEKDEISEEKNDERTEKHELNKILAAQAGRSSGLFKELSKPEKLGKLVVYVILLLILAFNIIKTLKLSSNFEQQSVLEYDHQEL